MAYSASSLAIVLMAHACNLGMIPCQGLDHSQGKGCCQRGQLGFDEAEY